jgi:nicotinamidase-related amidase
VRPLLALRAELEALRAPVIYVNDHFGKWHSERSRLISRAIDSGSSLSERLAPDDADYFIIKPQFCGFYATNLPVLLPKLGIDRLILAGVATDVSVLLTAADAHMRDYKLRIPADLVKAVDDQRSHDALAIMAEAMGAEIAPTSALSLRQWLDRGNAAKSP